MKTAVEWLIDKHFGGIENCTPDFKKHIEKAIEMEKQQIFESWDNGFDNGYYYGKYNENCEIYYGQQYYNETFKK